MSQIVWLPEVPDDIEGLVGFLKREYPPAVTRLQTEIRNAVRLLAENPRSGKPIPDEDSLHPVRREWFVPFGASAYVLRYRLVDDCVVIIRVWHGREARES